MSALGRKAAQEDGGPAEDRPVGGGLGSGAINGLRRSRGKADASGPCCGACSCFLSQLLSVTILEIVSIFS